MLFVRRYNKASFGNSDLLIMFEKQGGHKQALIKLLKFYLRHNLLLIHFSLVMAFLRKKMYSHYSKKLNEIHKYMIQTRFFFIF